MLLDDTAKEIFWRWMRTMADFCGVQVLTCDLRQSAFAVSLQKEEPISDKELLLRYAVLYSKVPGKVSAFENLLKRGGKEAEHERERQLKRMGDISFFMKEVKQRFGIWYNKSHNRIGTLWTERFKGVLVENSRTALMTVAAYIDLDPVRVGLC